MIRSRMSNLYQHIRIGETEVCLWWGKSHRSKKVNTSNFSNVCISKNLKIELRSKFDLFKRSSKYKIELLKVKVCTLTSNRFDEFIQYKIEFDLQEFAIYVNLHKENSIAWVPVRKRNTSRVTRWGKGHCVNVIQQMYMFTKVLRPKT